MRQRTHLTATLIAALLTTALACPPPSQQYTPWPGAPFHYQSPTGELPTCSATWFTFDPSALAELQPDDPDFDAAVERLTSIAEASMHDHPSAAPVILDPDTIVGPIPLDEPLAHRITIDQHTYLVAIYTLRDPIYDDAMIIRLVFELPPRPAAD